MSEVVDLNYLRLNRSRSKFCDCYKYLDKPPKYEIDTSNRVIECRYCQTIVEPFEALINLAKYYEKIQEDLERAKQYKNELMSYKPYLRQAKRYEKMMREKDMLPLCPNCNESFEWQDVTSMTNKKFLKKRGDLIE